MASGRWCSFRRPRAERRHPPGRRARAGTHGVQRGRLLGPRRELRRARHRLRRSPRRARRQRIATGRDFDAATGALNPRSDVAPPRRRPMPSRSPNDSATPRSPSRRRSRSRSRNVPRRRSRRPRCSRKPGTSCGSARRAPCRSHRASTSGATSPTCGPTPCSSRSRRSMRLERQIVERFGRRLPPAAGPFLRQQGQERAGSARSDPAGRCAVPDARRRGERAQPRRTGPLRAGVDANRRQSDDRRAWSHAHIAARRRVEHERAGDLPDVGPHVRVPRLPRGLRRRE